MENGYDVDGIFSGIVEIENQIFLVNEKSISGAFEHSVFGQGTAFGECFKDFAFFPKLAYKTGRSFFVLGVSDDIKGDFPQV